MLGGSVVVDSILRLIAHLAHGIGFGIESFFIRFIAPYFGKVGLFFQHVFLRFVLLFDQIFLSFLFAFSAGTQGGNVAQGHICATFEPSALARRGLQGLLDLVHGRPD